MKTKKIGARIFALFCMIMMSSLTVSSAYALQIPSLENAAAQSAGICAVDKTGRYFCNESISEDDCYLWRAGKTVDTAEECTLGTCVPLENGGCISPMKKIACEYNNAGKWYASESEDVADCNVGCCVAPNKAECSQLEKASCEKKNYEWSTKSESDCKIECGAAEYGCCEESGNFLNKHRSECTGKFYGNEVYCSLVVGSGVRGCTDVQPGNGQTDGDKQDCYCYDSEKTREGIASASKEIRHISAEGNEQTGSGNCSATEICKDNDGAMGEFAYCGSTSCVDWCPNCEPSTLKNGESICANVNLGFFNPGMRSSYLQNWIIRCQNGEIKADNSFDPQAKREKICVEKVENELRTTSAIANKWEECLKCGNGDNVLDVIGYIPLLGPLGLGVLRPFGIGDICQGDLPPGIGDKCSDFGKTKIDGKDVRMCNGGIDNYDHDMWAPIGSCNPIYTPGTKDTNDGQCGQCGEGGDSITNVCTEEECEHMGDCQFYPDAGTAGVLTAGATALGTCAASYIGCKYLASLISWTGACEQGASQVCRSMISLNPNMLYWGGYSLIYGITAGIAAAPNTDIKEQQVKLAEGKVLLKDAIMSGKSIEKSYPGWAYFGALVTAAADINLNLGKVGTLGFQRGAEIIGRRFIQNQIQSEITKQANNFVACVNTPKATCAFTELKNILEKYGYSGDTMDVLYRKKGAESIESISKNAAQKASLTEVSKTGKVLISAFNVAGILLNVYFAGRAMNTGECKAESAYNYDEKKKAFGEENVANVCEQCGWGEGQPWCTEKRCNILGGANGNCRYAKSDGKEDGRCITIVPTDVAAPEITSLKIEYFDHNKRKLSEDTGTAKTDRTTDLPYNMTYVKITIDTNEDAQCGYSASEGQEQSKMSPFANDTLYPTKHETDYIPILRNVLPATFTYYIKCVDAAGNTQAAGDDKYFARFKVAGGPDYAPPVIEFIDPAGFMPEGTSSINLTVLAYDTNGVTECSAIVNNTSTSMARQSNQRCVTTTISKCDKFSLPKIALTCLDLTLGNAAAIGLSGDELQAFTQQQSEFAGTKICPLSVKCKDSKDNEAEFNNTIVVTSLFNITIADIADKYDRNPLFNATTTRSATCSYEISNKVYTFDDPVYGAKQHVIIHNETLLPNSYRIKVTCKDIAKTTRIAIKDFTILSDSTPPEIVRAYSDGNILYIVTSEKARCAYSPKDCTFNIEDGTGMPEGRESFEMTHEALWRTDIIYYIKCTDKWENTPKCVVLNPVEVPKI